MASTFIKPTFNKKNVCGRPLYQPTNRPAELLVKFCGIKSKNTLNQKQIDVLIELRLPIRIYSAVVTYEEGSNG